MVSRIEPKFNTTSLWCNTYCVVCLSWLSTQFIIRKCPWWKCDFHHDTQPLTHNPFSGYSVTVHVLEQCLHSPCFSQNLQTSAKIKRIILHCYYSLFNILQSQMKNHLITCYTILLAERQTSPRNLGLLKASPFRRRSPSLGSVYTYTCRHTHTNLTYLCFHLYKLL